MGMKVAANVGSYKNWKASKCNLCGCQYIGRISAKNSENIRQGLDYCPNCVSHILEMTEDKWTVLQRKSICAMHKIEDKVSFLSMDVICQRSLILAMIESGKVPYEL